MNIKKKYKQVVFDLDGTLIDSLTDIANAMNIVLEKEGFLRRTKKEYRLFIGNGIDVLIRKAADLSQENIEKIKQLRGCFDKEYDAQWNKNLTIFDGVLAMLKKLNDDNVQIHILSNKTDYFVRKFIAEAFPSFPFISVQGIQHTRERKPNPALLNSILESSNLKNEQTLFIGDGGADIEVAHNANLDVAWVSWGYRNKKEIVNLKPTYSIHNVMDIVDFF